MSLISAGSISLDSTFKEPAQDKEVSTVVGSIDVTSTTIIPQELHSTYSCTDTTLINYAYSLDHNKL